VGTATEEGNGERFDLEKRGDARPLTEYDDDDDDDVVDDTSAGW